MGCFQSRDGENTGWCGLTVGGDQKKDDLPALSPDQSKSGLKPSEVLPLSQEVTNGLLGTYQKVNYLNDMIAGG